MYLLYLLFFFFIATKFATELNIRFAKSNIRTLLLEYFSSACLPLLHRFPTSSDNYTSFYSVSALNTLNRLNKEGEALALEDDLTTHPTLALMRRILADAQVSTFRTSFAIVVANFRANTFFYLSQKSDNVSL